MKPMKLGLVSFLLAIPLLALAVTLVPRNAAAQPSGATPTVLSTHRTWEVTEGPTAGTFSFPDGDHRGVMVKGKITPPLPDGVTAGISSATPKGCVPDAQPLDLGCVMGGAQGGSFTGYVKTGAGCLAANCTKITLCFITDGDPTEEYCITIRNPDVSSYVAIDPSVTGVVPGIDYTVPIAVLGLDGQVNTAFDGTVTVVPGSLFGSGVLIDGASGMTTVEIVEGVGSMTVRCESAVLGDVLTFDIFGGGRLSPRRSSLDVY